MPIFDMYGGRQNLFTADEIDKITNPNKFNFTQAQYDAFVAEATSRRGARRAVDAASRDVVPTSYAHAGTGGTNPLLSFAGMSGHTSGELAGRSGLSGFAEGGMVEQEGIGGLLNAPASMDPILEHHYRNLAEGKAVTNEDGSVSTVYTSQVDIDGTPTLIPRIWDGQVLSDEAALERALASGKTWPTAETHADLRQYDMMLHEELTPRTPEAAQEVLTGGEASQPYAQGGVGELFQNSMSSGRPQAY